MIKYKYIFIFLIQVLSLIIQSRGQNANKCNGKKTCEKCITADPICAWCTDETFENTQRCNTESILRQKCKSINREKNSHQIINNREFNDSLVNTVQLKPQKFRINLKPNEPVTISIHFRQAQDYPMDLYYLMDLSCTMLQYKDTVGNVGENLAKAMKKTTKNFQMGFGRFVDKPMVPYAAYNLKSGKCRNYKTGVEEDTEPPYSFINHLPLSTDVNNFENGVRNAKTSGNVDKPEGTLDALMQVLTCKEQIKWRDNSRKIIVVVTDEDFHFAGDGKLAGILTPNDGKCHMKDNRYTDYDVLDYPSAAHIANTISETKINVVFAVHEKVNDIYKNLVETIGPLSRVAPLNDIRDQTIINLIKNIYDNISSTIEMSVESASKIPDVDVELWSRCNGPRREKRNRCTGFKKNDVITFDAEITLKKCPEDKRLWNREMKIGLTNINEAVQLELNMICECQCEQKKRAEENSPKCSFNGTFACGVCAKCNGIRSGARCECNPQEPIDLNDPTAKCRRKGESTACLNLGECECGQCQCKSPLSGTYCECDNTKCIDNGPESNGIECSGNGQCDCGKCECDAGFSGDFCECPLSNKTCIKPEDTNGEVCSGYGKCKCGKCECNLCDCGKSTGKYCQKCPCENLCEDITRCMPKICDYHNGTECTKCVKINNTLSLIIDENYTDYESITSSGRRCTLKDPNLCDLYFLYNRTEGSDDNELPWIIATVPHQSCPQPIDIVMASISLIGGIIVVGIGTLLLWKLFTEIFDRREFAKFNKEIANANWDESGNPLFKPSTSTFQNPTFGTSMKKAKQ